MIPNNHPYDAVYRHDSGRKLPNGNTLWNWDRLPVIAWNNDREPLVAHPRASRLAPATDYADFYGLEERTDVVSVIPGGGWKVAHREPDGTETHDLVLAWVARTDGTLTPVDADSADTAFPPTNLDTFDRLIAPKDPTPMITQSAN